MPAFHPFRDQGKEMTMLFRDRRDAGRRLADLLLGYAQREAVVLGLPRGGVPVAFEVAARLRVPLDVLLVRKLGVPFQPELGMGAIGEGGIRVLNDDLVRRLGISHRDVDGVVAREASELERRASVYRGDRPAIDVTGRTVILVDDGLATGFTARAGVQVLRRLHAAEVVLAVPVGSPVSLREIEPEVDRVVYVRAPESFMGVGQWYDDFSQTTDAEVVALLRRADEWSRAREPQNPAEPVVRDVDVDVDGVRLAGRLTLAADAASVVAFAHGSGSSRLSPRNVAVARALNRVGLGTLLFDLLTPAEADDRRNVFDIPLLAARLDAATRWLGRLDSTAHLPVGYFGASTGAGAALWAAAEPGSRVAAVVSRGGRPDLAGARLSDVRAPTLLIVGGRDEAVLEMNERAERTLRCEKRLVVVPGATHLFEEPGTLEQVAVLAAEWLRRHLMGSAGRLAS